EWRSVLCQGPVAGMDLPTACELWVEEQKQSPRYASVEVERSGEAVVADRTVQLHVVRAKLREDHGMAPTVRAALCAFAREDGTTVQVVICAFDLDWDLAGLDRVLASLRWLETR